MSIKVKKIIIMRHANAKPTTPPPGLTDKERPLSKKGWEELKNIGKKDREAFKEVSLVLCSGATRTRETLEGVMGYLPNVQKVLYLDELYLAPVWIYLEEINLWKNDHSVILMVGHNPTVSEFFANVYEATGTLGEGIESVPTAGVRVYAVRSQGDEEIGYRDLEIEG